MLWLAVATPDVPDALQLLEEHERAELSRMDPDGSVTRAAEHVIDLDADEASCPACGAGIPQGRLRCPGCGLRIG